MNRDQRRQNWRIDRERKAREDADRIVREAITAARERAERRADAPGA